MPRITPLRMDLISAPAFAERFWSKVDRSGDGCWPWLGQRNQAGYGQTEKMVAGKRHVMLAHRIAWALTNGVIPDGLLVLHSCDNPSCCNPGHLRCGTSRENAADMLERGRHVVPDVARQKGAAHPAARYTTAQRRLALRLLRAFKPNWVVAQAVGCPRGTITQWAKEWGLSKRARAVKTAAYYAEIRRTGRWSGWQEGWYMLDGKPTYTGGKG